MNCCGHTLEGVKFRNEKNKNFFEFIFWWIYLSQHKKAGGKLCVLVRIWKLMTIERRRILTKAFIEFAWLLSSCGCSLRNSDAKYVGNNMPRRFQNFSVCLGNNSAKKKKKMPKTQPKPLYITLAMASAYLGILPRAMICFFNSWDYLFYLNYNVYL